MGSLVLDVLRKGIWSSFCGGWYYDPTSATFANTFHLYLFLFFLCFPFSVYVYLPRNALNWTVYTSVVGIIFITIKFTNVALHRMFDNSECVVEEQLTTNAVPESEKRKSSQKLETLEDEGIELQVLSSDKKSESQPNENSISIDTVEFADFNSIGVKQDTPVTTSGTIDLKVDVHRKNSSDSNDEPSAKNDHIHVIDEVNQEKQVKVGETIGSKVTVTTSEEALIENDSSKNCRKRSLKENASKDVCVAVDSVEGSAGRLCERSRQYSVSVTLGEGSGETNTITDPAPARSMQLNTEYEADANKNASEKGLLYWKEKWDKSSSRRPKIVPLDSPRPGPSRRSSSPISLYASDIVYPILEHVDEQQYSGLKRSSAHSDDDEDDDDYLHRPDDDEDVYGDVEDLDADGLDGSHSPLLVQKPIGSAPNDDSSPEIPSFNRKKGYVDSLTRKHRHEDGKSNKYANEEGGSIRGTSFVELEDSSAEKGQIEKQFEDVEQVGPIFKWLFDEGTRSSHDSNKRTNRDRTKQHEVKNKYPDIFEVTRSRLKFSSAPTLSLINGGQEKTACHRRQRSGTCSQLEIGPSQSSIERKTSLPETSVAQSTSADVYMITSIDDVRETKQSCPQPTESNEASSSGSNTELSSLLPPPYNTPINSPGSTPYYYGRRTTTLGCNGRNSRNRNRRQARRHRSSIREAFPSSSTSRNSASTSRPGAESEDFLDTLRDIYFGFKGMSGNTHVADSHDDTTEGATHIFQDENGDWMSYTFDERGTGLAVCLAAGRNTRRRGRTLNPIEEQNKNSASGSALRVATCSTLMNPYPPRDLYRDDACSTFMNTYPEPAAATSAPGGASSIASGNAQNEAEPSSHSQLYQIRENDNGTYCFESVEYPAPFLNIPYSQTFANNAFPLRFNPLARLHVTGPANSQSDVNMEYGLPRGRFDCMADHIEVLEDEKRKRRYYKFGFFPLSKVKIYFDRLSLDALLDYNETYFETIVCILLAVSVSFLGAVILHLRYYHDIPAFVFCFVMATSHYSLLKSVQPDAASPVHGFNKIVAYSRPVYFILCCSLIVGLHYLLRSEIAWVSSSFLSIGCDPYSILKVTHDFLCTFILFFPLFFTLGMFPQVNTFLMYVFEQLDMHVFGGSAVTSLKAAAYCVFRSLLAVFLLFGFAYGGLSEQPKPAQHILFSIFVSLLVMFAFHLSRSTCDPTPVWNILVKQFWPIDELTKQSKQVRKVKTNQKRPTEKKKKPKKKLSVTYGNEIKVEAVDDREASVRVSISQQSSSEPADTETLKKKSVLDEDLENAEDTLSAFMQKVFNSRLQSDLIVSCTAGILLFAIHRSTIFTVLKKDLNSIMWSIACSIGFLLHYIVPQLRKPLPWLCISRPLLRSLEHELFEAQAPATVTWFEKVYLYLGFLEKNVIYPVMFIGCITSDASVLAESVGALASSVILTICGLKCLRLSYSHISCQYLILAFTVLFNQWEYTTSVFVVDYFIISILYYKIYDLLLKVQFVLTYIAPWQITWGSAFHAFAQPFSLPHSAMMFAQAALSAVLSSPLYPFLGSAIFLTSYPRPVKFWERDYNTRRVDHSNTKMASHLERNLGCDDNNLNSIFYEHLTRSLQRSLCGDLLMGRWGEVSAGDCYILASDYLNCLIHIVELGNGLVTFQMRGLEFRGTYCQQREVEAITDGVEENDGCCCCKPGHLPYMLSLNAAFSQRWLAWEVTSAKYILEGYSISDNSAASMLQVFDFRKMLISYYVKSIIYYAITSPKLEEWINSTTLRDALHAIKDKNFVDLDPVFNMNIDEDYDYRYSGITRNSFCGIYMTWIRFCNSQRKKPVVDISKDSSLVTLCFALSLLGRRTLGTASHNTAASVEFFLYGVHTLFKGDFRIASTRDEWVFIDMELLRKVVAPAIRMSLKLHQDHFMAPDEYESPPALYAAISLHEDTIVISHEGDPVWRKAVLSGMPHLLALRRVMEEGSDDYKIIMLSKRFLNFRVIKMNRECVRGLWAGQQQELVFLRNLNPERGSIQNAKQALRNIINSSCDQPIGYPIFVSPLTTSYAETNPHYTQYLGGAISIKSIKNFVFNFCSRVRKRCVEGCSSGSSAHSQDDGGFGHEGVYSMTTFNVHSSSHQSMETSITGSGGTITRVSTGSGMSNRPIPSPAGPSKPGFVKLTDLLSPPGNSPLPEPMKLQERKSSDKDEEEKEPILHRVKITDPGQVHDGINQGRLIDVIWPDEIMRQRGGRNFWKDWVPEAGMEGQVVHRWIPNHPNPNKRSTFDRTILLIKIDDKYVPISENGVQDLGAEV